MNAPGSWPAHVFIDNDGRHVVFSHKCNGEIRTTQLPHPTWTMDAAGLVTPSIHCKACSYHDTLSAIAGSAVPSPEATRP